MRFTPLGLFFLLPFQAMADYAIVADWDENKHVTRYNLVSTEAEAVAIVNRLHTLPLKDRAPKAYYVEMPSMNPGFEGFVHQAQYWIADPVSETVVFDYAALKVDQAGRIKKHLKTAFENEALVRIAAQVPELDDLKAVKSYSAFWAANPPPSPTAAQSKARNIYVWMMETAFPKLDALTEPSDLMAVVVNVDDPFGDGVLWP
jgi:hypothetical protein